MKLIEAKLDSYLKSELEKIIKLIHRRENKILSELESVEERECGITSLWNKSIQYIEDHAIELIQKKAELQKKFEVQDESTS